MSLGWHVISGEDLLEALRRVERGEKADLVFAELWANASHEQIEGGEKPPTDAVVLSDGHRGKMVFGRGDKSVSDLTEEREDRLPAIKEAIFESCGNPPQHITWMVQEIDLLRAALDAARAERDVSRRDHAAEWAKGQNLKREVVALREERDEMEGRYVQAHTDGENARREVAVLRAENAEDAERWSNANSRLMSLLPSLRAARDERDALKITTRTITSQLLEREREVEALREERDEMENRLAQSLSRSEAAALREALERIVFGTALRLPDLRTIARDALAGGSGNNCKHESSSFDRSVCACGSMHDYCDDCGKALDCPYEKT